MPEPTRKRPDLEVRAGTISVAVWNEPPARDGRAGPTYTLRVEKRYRDEKSGQWRSTSFFRLDELPKLVLAAMEAYRLLTLRVAGGTPGGVNVAGSDRRVPARPE